MPLPRPSPRHLPMLALALLVVWSALLGRPAASGLGPPFAPTPTPAAAVAAPERADGGLARALDRFMRRAVPESPLVGLGRVFAREGRAARVDPRLLVAIALQESRLGTAGSGPAARNAFGWGPAIRFASWPAGIRTVARGLRRDYLARGRDTIAAIAPVWAPTGAPNDRAGINGGWEAAISARYAELGGDPWSTVALPPEA
ncbi:MAG: hypothetical protein QOK40_3363 [Miltoncostaeaceae bacterium]|nr:hypothetical protein [Miltoncostaeaceae bacterium]